jgi:ribose transport system permease protein
VVVVLRVDSFIATLATGALIQSLITMVTNDSSITGVQLLAKPFTSIAQLDAGGITLPVLYLLLAATAIWFLLEHTASGRRLYATGFNADAARLQGVRTDRLRFLTLVASALLSGFAGIVFASSVGSGSPTAGTPYLLSAYAAAFVGATQLRAGRFNAWGTVLAVLLLGTGITGLGLATSAQWAASLFTGSVLIVALVLTGGRIALPAVLRRRKSPPAEPVPMPMPDKET